MYFKILSFEFKISVIRAVRSNRWRHANNWSATPTTELANSFQPRAEIIYAPLEHAR